MTDWAVFPGVGNPTMRLVVTQIFARKAHFLRRVATG